MTAVLITGCSSGIGRATALRLARRPDLAVYATARRPQALADLAAAGCQALALDVTDEASMLDAVRTIEARHGAIGVLVNNAGYGEYGTVEETPLDLVREQFETNVFGLSRLTQLALPAMRVAGTGRIVNVSSMGGRIVFPMGGYYHASKFAVEAISDALRFEARPFGIHVSLVEPGLIRTGFEEIAQRSLASSASPAGPYRRLAAVASSQTTKSYRSSLTAASPETVARVIERAATARHPRPRYVITAAARMLVHTRRLLGARVFDTYLRWQFATPQRSAG